MICKQADIHEISFKTSFKIHFEFTFLRKKEIQDFRT